MSIYDAFGTNKELEKNGVWIDVDGGARFLVARIGAIGCEYDKMLRVKTKPHRRAIENETIDPKMVQKLTAETFARTSVLNWEGVKDDEGNDMPFSQENAVKLLLELPELAGVLIDFARDFQNYKKVQMEEDAKNFETA